MTWSTGSSPRQHRTGCLTDIAEHPTAEGKLFLCSIKDCYSNRIDRFSDTEAPYTSAKCAEISPVVNPFA